SLSVSAGDQIVYSHMDMEGKSESGSFNYTVPESINALTFVLDVTDVYGNSGQSNWHFDVGADSPPAISIRHPAAGTRFVEGEALTINALVTDDRQLSEVVFFKRVDGLDHVLQSYNQSAAAQIVANN